MTLRLDILLQRIKNRFLGREDGAVLVEFALIFPLMLLFFAASVDAARLLFGYHQAINGVRDASRYLGRAAPYEICTGAGTFVRPNPDYLDTAITNIVNGNMSGDAKIFDSGVTVDDVIYSVACTDDSGLSSQFADDKVMIATVRAQLTIRFPLGVLFGMFGAKWTQVTVNVADQVRVYGQ